MNQQESKRLYKLIHNYGQPVRFNPKPSRNDICPCGSGKKFKKCHIVGWDEWLKEYFKNRKQTEKKRR
ncbi:MAG TPA: SEC-C metal-binding domain-containing protein [Brumimicrobium sp.]|nr:SEC-C metal-binding domain-containing protein [Brumimicrobium sp.]